MEPSLWPQFIKKLLIQVFAFPEDPNSVKLVSQISSNLNLYLSHLVPTLIDKMIKQSKLTEEMLQDKSENSIVKSLLFERLRPLLVFRCLSPIPLSKYLTENPETLNSLQEELLQRMTQIFEFDEVRKLSAEIFGKIPSGVSLPLIQSKILESKEKKDWNTTKVFLYAFCNTILYFKTTIEAESATLVILQLLPILQTKENSENFQKLQMGIIDATSIVLGTFYTLESKLYTLLLDSLLQVDSVPTALMTVNVFISSFKHFSLASLEEFSKNFFGKVFRFFPKISKMPAFQAGIVQMLFQLSYSLKDQLTPFVIDLLKLCLDCLPSPNDMVIYKSF